jgi:four helix bundle protein
MNEESRVERTGDREGADRQAKNPSIRGHRDLLVLQKAMALAKIVYQLTARFPAEEKFGLISQMRRAAVSVPSNIAEGHARRTTGEFVQFISHAEGSLPELDTQTRLSVELYFCGPLEAEAVLTSVTEVRKMLTSLRRKLPLIPNLYSLCSSI